MRWDSLGDNAKKSSSGRDAESPAKPMARKGMGCLGNGLQTPPRFSSLQMTAVGSTL